MRLRARFIGADGSLGYRHGNTYDLEVHGSRITSPTPCPYGSVEAFLLNWRPESDGEADAMRQVVAVAELPYLHVTTFQDRPTERRPDPPTGYAVVLKGRMNEWCHDPDATDPPFFWHRTEDDAWACFEQHHPGLRDAIAAVEAMSLGG